MRKNFEKTKENFQNELNEDLNLLKLTHENLMSKIEAELDQLKSAQVNKRNTLEMRALSAVKLTEIIENQKQELRENSEHLRKLGMLLSAEIMQRTEVYEKRFRCISIDIGIFKEAKTSHDKVVALSNSLYTSNVVNNLDVFALLTSITLGRLDAVERELQHNPKLALAQGTVTDLTGRELTNITAFQLAYWYLDDRMCDILCRYLYKSQAALQLDAFENYRKDITNSYRSGFNFLDKTIARFQSFINAVNDHRLMQIDPSSWSKAIEQEFYEISSLQNEWPAWFVYAFCDSKKDAAWVTMNFTKNINRPYHKDNNIRNWYEWEGCVRGRISYCNKNLLIEKNNSSDLEWFSNNFVIIRRENLWGGKY